MKLDKSMNVTPPETPPGIDIGVVLDGRGGLGFFAVSNRGLKWVMGMVEGYEQRWSSEHVDHFYHPHANSFLVHARLAGLVVDVNQ